MSERFGHITIDNPAATQGSDTTHQAAAPSAPAPGFWQRVFGGERAERSRRLREQLAPAQGENYRMVRMDELCRTLGIDITPGTGRRRDRDLLSRLGYELSRLDLRMGRSIIGKAVPKSDETVALYESRHGEPPKRGTLPVGLFLAAWLVSADGVTPRDLEIIDHWIVESVGNADEAVPAIATLRWLTGRKLILTAWRKARCASLTRFVHRRASLVRLLLRLVTEGSSVSPARMARLQTIYGLIGLDSADIHSDLHRMATETTSSGSGRLSSKTAAGVDRHRLSQMTADTARAQALLADVFGGEEDEAETAQSTTTTDPTLELVRTLAGKAEWSLDDFGALCAGSHETPAAMLERLNDLSYETVDEPLAEEDGDKILIDTAVAQQILRDRGTLSPQ